MNVLVCAEKEANRIWESYHKENSHFNIKVLPGKSFFVQRFEWSLHFNFSIFRELKILKPSHIVAAGYDAPTVLAAMIYSKVYKIPLTLWFGSHKMSSRVSKGLIPFIRKSIVKLADSYVTYGTLASDYLVSMGIKGDKIITATNTVDVMHIKDLISPNQSLLQKQSEANFLYVGQFIERKGVIELLNAFANMPNNSSTLTLVGYGPLKEKIIQIIQDKKIRNVILAGSTKTLEETVPYFLKSNILVMPSLSEVWGLVVNEALAAGMFVLSSKYAGATVDLIKNAPINVGMAIDPLDSLKFTEQLMQAREYIINSSINQDAIMQWGCSQTPEKYADAILKAINIS